MNLTNASAGVDYEAMLDPFKLKAQRAARETASNIRRFNGEKFREVPSSRGESVHLIETDDFLLAHVLEGLGTKNLVADAMYVLTGKSYYDQIAQCAVATIVNDMITSGARPRSVAMHLAVGVSEWFADERRSSDLVNGWKKACNLARCSWGGGETPALKGVVVPGTVELSGSAIGVVYPKERLITDRIEHGDTVVIIESSGIHANGLSIARKIGDRKDGFWRKFGHLFFPDRFPLEALPQGYLTRLSDGRTYGETLLDPTHIYVGLVEDCQNCGVDIHYAVNITGHGWRKFMRSNRSFTYVIDILPSPLPIFGFLQEHGPIDDYHAYGHLNMGAGFALYVSESQADLVIEVAGKLGLTAFVAGHIEEGDKKVVISPLGLEYGEDTIAIR